MELVPWGADRVDDLVDLLFSNLGVRLQSAINQDIDVALLPIL
jgi:hypothetical protein